MMQPFVMPVMPNLSVCLGGEQKNTFCFIQKNNYLFWQNKGKFECIDINNNNIHRNKLKTSQECETALTSQY